jgi:hypothetical protein
MPFRQQVREKGRKALRYGPEIGNKAPGPALEGQAQHRAGGIIDIRLFEGEEMPVAGETGDDADLAAM